MHKKVILNFSITILLLIVLGVVSIFKMIELADVTQKLYDHPFTVTNATKTIESSLISMHRYMKDVALANNPTEIQMAVQKVNANEIIIYKEFDTIFKRYLGNRDDITKSYDAFVNWKPIRDEVIALMQRGQKNEAALITKDKGAKHVENLNMQVQKLVDYAQEKADYFYLDAIKTKETSIIITLFLLGTILFIVISMYIFLIKNLSTKEKELKKHFHLIDQNIMMATLSKELMIIKCSSSLARHLGFSKKEILHSAKDFLLSDCSDDKRLRISKIIQSGKSWEGEIKKVDNNDEVKWLQAYIHPIFDADYNVTGYTNIFEDISSKKEIEVISKTDALTSLYNRRYFDELFPKQIKIASRHKIMLAFVMIDIDHFKQYNDIYGHQAGDTALKKVAYGIEHSLKRPDDYTFRLGGEEFGALFHITNKGEGLNLANKIRENIEHLQIEHSGNSASKFVTISMGLYIIEPDDDADVQELYKKCDNALYKAKQEGRNRVVTLQLS